MMAQPLLEKTLADLEWHRLEEAVAHERRAAFPDQLEVFYYCTREDPSALGPNYIKGRPTFEFVTVPELRRMKELEAIGDLTAYLAGRMDSPVWHRAVRLYGLFLLEQHRDLGFGIRGEARHRACGPASARC